MTEKDIRIIGHGSKNPSSKNLYTYNKQRYQSGKEVVVVMRLKQLNAQGRKRFTKTYEQILGRNNYSQSLRQYVYSPYKDGKYYSDCSSSGMATFRQIGYDVPLLNTVGIYQSKLFEKVPVVIKDGHITNPEILEIGDCILYKGTDKSRPLMIGHVEYVYEKTPEEDYIEAGKKVRLRGANLYASAYTDKVAGKKYGEFYLWSAEIVKGRVRITNSKANVGVAKQVTGWVERSALWI